MEKEVVLHLRPQGGAVGARVLPDRSAVARPAAKAKEKVAANPETVQILGKGTRVNLKVPAGPQEAREGEQPHLLKQNTITSTFAFALIT